MWLWGVALTGLLASNCAAAALYAGSPNEIFQFGADARAIGMGNAYTAVADGSSALYYNPAGLGLLNGPQVGAMQASLIGGAAYDYLSYGQNFSQVPGAWSVEALHMGVSGAEQRDSMNNLTGSFGFQETGYGAGFGFRNVLIPDLSLGGSFQGLSQSLQGTSSDMLYGANLGAQYGPFFDDMVTAGFVLQNGISGAQQTSDRLPTVMRAGIAVRPFSNFLVSADYGNDGGYGLGIEYRIWMFALRAGYMPQGLTFGGGVYYKSFEADIAMLNDPIFGIGERFSLNYRFGGKKKEKPLETYTNTYLDVAQKELDHRNYLSAELAIEDAIGVDSSKVSTDWQAKVKRLKALSKALDLKSNPNEAKTLMRQDEPATLAQKAVLSYLNDQDGTAMIWATVAAGASGRNSQYIDFAKAMAYLTKRNLSEDNMLPPTEFVSQEMDKSLHAIYQKKFAAAVKECRDALVVNPKDARAWTRLGSAYFAWGHKEEAKQAYNKALDLAPDNANLKKFMENYLK